MVPAPRTDWQLAPNSAIILLGALGVLYITMPFVELFPYGGAVEALLVGIVMVFSIAAVGGRAHSAMIAIALLLPAFGGRVLHLAFPEIVPDWLYRAATAVFFGYAVLHLVRFILRSPVIDNNVLCAALATYLMLALLWVPLYALADDLNPNAFSYGGAPQTGAMEGFNALYFSMITLCTVGYGDILPVSSMARMLVVMQVVTGVFYTGVFISRLVAVYTANQGSQQ